MRVTAPYRRGVQERGANAIGSLTRYYDAPGRIHHLPRPNLPPWPQRHAPVSPIRRAALRGRAKARRLSRLWRFARRATGVVDVGAGRSASERTSYRIAEHEMMLVMSASGVWLPASPERGDA